MRTPGRLKSTLKTGVSSLCCARTRLQCEAFLEEFSAVVSQNFPTESCRRADSRWQQSTLHPCLCLEQGRQSTICPGWAHQCFPHKPDSLVVLTPSKLWCPPEFQWGLSLRIHECNKDQHSERFFSGLVQEPQANFKKGDLFILTLRNLILHPSVSHGLLKSFSKKKVPDPLSSHLSKMQSST